MMDVAELRAFIAEHFTRTAFRLEALQQYEVASDGSDFARYLAGEPAPTPERKEPWLAKLRDERSRGMYRHRVRIVTRPVSDYTRFECEWGYAPNSAAGEDIRIYDVGDLPLPELRYPANDFWLLDDTYGIDMRYADDGQFIGAAELPDWAVRRARAAETVLWRRSEPFNTWWARHTELHRDHRKVA